MSDIQASAKVAALIGTEKLDRLRHSPGNSTFNCWHCGLRADANTEAATVIAEAGPVDGPVRTALAHAECSPSQVVDTGAAALAALPELKAGAATAGVDGAVHWRPMRADLPVQNGFLPLLILDLRPTMAVRGGPDEHVTRSISALRDSGLTPITTISQQLADALDNQPGDPEPWDVPSAAGWRFELAGRRIQRLTAPDGSLIWGQDQDQPGQWRRLITRTRRCVVLIGAIGLYPESDERPFTWLTTLLKQAADAGELVGGLVETGWIGSSDGTSSS
ncbi:hypothetical protein [Amycolatopsis sp. PS_44_ISF1]|uniref:hypothetical protein n=1 Tax=Amycolatopsis sp. PS_44_ISF1 TaxID=2974917 RepID=UPI0028DDF274|nr:hypothetical protein [Amycolatopsis sp. PS_44_ISF1]MDT8910760.1 hypothetical protein [Amycolatopsis sp. PS_44_ISF1]